MYYFNSLHRIYLKSIRPCSVLIRNGEPVELQFKSLIVLFLVSLSIFPMFPRNGNRQTRTKSRNIIRIVPEFKVESRDVCKETGDAIWALLRGPYKNTAAFLISEARIAMLSECKHSFGNCSNEEFAERLKYAIKAGLDIYLKIMNDICVSSINNETVAFENQKLNLHLIEDYHEYMSVSYFYLEYIYFIDWNVQIFRSELVRKSIVDWLVSPFLK